MIRPIHNAVIEDAMSHPKHMTDLMDHNLHWAIEYFVVVRNIMRFVEKIFVVPCKWEYTCSIFYACQTEYKVPFVSGIEIKQSYSDYAEYLFVEFALE